MALAIYLSLAVVIAGFRLFHTQRKPLFTISPNIKIFIINFIILCREIFIFKCTEMFTICALHNAVKLAAHNAGNMAIIVPGLSTELMSGKSPLVR